MRVISLILFMGIALVSPTNAAAQGRISPPFSKLFRAPTTPLATPSVPAAPFDLKSAAKQLLQARQPARIVCGMTMVPVDASLDPKIERPVPGNGTKFTLKLVKPPVCGQ